ncbi:uncharacterized protein LOC141841768 [Curcuma longa]|uniref:uncharacterized protein LOC141841768 n=1 Tax=Curcuma longa TaxID=136217 RepID=UPI003D9EBE6C
MARKGYQQRNGLNCNTPDHTAVISDSVKEKSEIQNGMPAETDHLNTDNLCHSRSPGAKTNKPKANGKKNRQRAGHTLAREKSDDENPILPQTMDKSLNLQDLPRSTPSSDASKKVGTDGTFSDIDGLHVESNNATFITMASRNLRSLVLYVSTAATHWLEGQKPWFKAINSVIHKSQCYVRAKLGHAYPIILTWAMYCGKLVLLLSMVWLDCSIRGLDSLLRLGTTSFLTTVWCSILSVTAMIGFVKMIIVTVIATAMVIGIGIGLTILILAVLALGILWFYGSFWVTGFVSILSGVTFMLGHDRIALLITTLYSMHCVRCYLGWLGLFFSLNASFISTDFLIYFLKNNINDYKSGSSSGEARQNQSQAGFSFRESYHSSHGADAFHSSSNMPPDRSSGFPSTSGTEELTSEDEVARLLKCSDHYSALGFSRYENVDVTQLKREYRKKAMLVHPDKNMGNDKAAEAFKKLQNGYEVLLDSLKRKAYDEELRKEELLNYFRRFQNSPQQKWKHGIFRPGFSHSEAEYEGPYKGESRRIACKKCKDFHIWICTDKSKSQARWCQDCKELHQAKDGDGWVEQSSQPLLLGLLQKLDLPRVYVCANSKIYEVTDWFACQGMNCPANTHKPSFHVNTSLTKQASFKGTGAASSSAAPREETMTEEEFFDWLQNAMQSGMFETNSTTPSESPSPANGNSSSKSSSSSSSTKRKKKGKKQW